MTRPRRVLRHFALAGLCCYLLIPAAAQQPTQAEADNLRAKIDSIIETAENPRAPDAKPVRTTFTDRDVNAYCKFYGTTFLPPGVAEPRLSIGERGRVTARAIVDLDAVRTAHKRGWLDPLAYLTGSLEVTAAGFVSGSNGTGTAQFESATVAGVSIPKAALQELVRFYTKTPARPNGFGLDEPFELPANIRSVTLERGRVTVLQ
jgi:hypothetical protein